MPTAPSFRLTVGKLASTSFGVYLRNLAPFFVLSVLIYLPWIAFEFWLAETPMTEADATPYRFLGFVVQSLLSFILTGAITYGVVMNLRGEPATMAATINRGLSSLMRVLGTGFYCSVQIFAYSLLLLVPGIIRSIRLYVAVPAAVMEDIAGTRAMARSVTLVEGSARAIAGAWGLVVVVSLVIAAVVGAVSAGIAEFDPQSPWFHVPFTLLLNTYSATMMACAYFMLRKGKENVDVAELAKVFD